MATAEDGSPGRLVGAPWCEKQRPCPVCKRHLAPILEIEAEQGFRSFVDKDEVARRIDHEGRDREAVGQLANQDQFNGSWATTTPAEIEDVHRVAHRGVTQANALGNGRWKPTAWLAPSTGRASRRNARRGADLVQ